MLPPAWGAIAPSSRRLAASVCAPVPERGEPIVVELGSGTGPFTAEIQRRLGGRGHHLAVELNDLLGAVASAMSPAGAFTTFSYIHTTAYACEPRS